MKIKVRAKENHLNRHEGYPFWVDELTLKKDAEYEVTVSDVDGGTYFMGEDAGMYFCHFLPAEWFYIADPPLKIEPVEIIDNDPLIEDRWDVI